MIGEGVLAEGRKKFEQFATFLFCEAGADPDVLQRSGFVEEAKQEGSDSYIVAVFVPAEAGDDAIAIAFVLHLEHGAFVGLIDTGNWLDDDSIEASAFKAAKPVGCDASLPCRWREVDRRRGGRQQFFQALATVVKRFSAEIVIALRKQIKKHDRGRGLLREQFDSRCGGMNAKLKGFEIESAIS